MIEYVAWVSPHNSRLNIKYISLECLPGFSLESHILVQCNWGSKERVAFVFSLSDMVCEEDALSLLCRNDVHYRPPIHFVRRPCCRFPPHADPCGSRRIQWCSEPIQISAFINSLHHHYYVTYYQLIFSSMDPWSWEYLSAWAHTNPEISFEHHSPQFQLWDDAQNPLFNQTRNFTFGRNMTQNTVKRNKRSTKHCSRLSLAKKRLCMNFIPNEEDRLCKTSFLGPMIKWVSSRPWPHVHDCAIPE